MPRRKRLESSTSIYHWINRGVNQKKLFHKNKDFDYFLDLVKTHAAQFDVKIYHYCLMTNHVHMLLHTDKIESLFRFSHYIQRRYAYYYCKTYKWRGQVFQRMYRSIPIDKETYLLECGRYIERNPIRAKLVQKPFQYPHSSHSFYISNHKNELLEPSPAYLALASSPKERKRIYQDYVSENRLYEELRDHVLMGG